MAFHPCTFSQMMDTKSTIIITRGFDVKQCYKMSQKGLHAQNVGSLPHWRVMSSATLTSLSPPRQKALRAGSPSSKAAPALSALALGKPEVTLDLTVSPSLHQRPTLPLGSHPSPCCDFYFFTKQ